MVIMHEKSKKSVDATRMAACTLCVVLVMLVGVDRANGNLSLVDYYNTARYVQGVAITGSYSYNGWIW